MAENSQRRFAVMGDNTFKIANKIILLYWSICNNILDDLK